MKIHLSIIMAVALATKSFAAGTSLPTVAVYEFSGDSKVRSYNSEVTALVTANLAGDTNLIMLDRSDLTKALSEQAFGVSGMVSSDAAAKIGQITGAKILVSGQVIALEENHIAIVANIIGTETARLFAAKVEGQGGNLVDLTATLSAKVAKIICEHAKHLIAEPPESSAARVERIVKGVTGKNRPSVLVNFYHPKGPHFPSFTANTEMGLILQKAGFTVVDGESEHKADIEISGVVDVDGRHAENDIHTEHAIVEMKVQQRRTGLIIALDRQESMAVEASQAGAQRAAQALAVDHLAERLLPLLAK